MVKSRREEEAYFYLYSSVGELERLLAAGAGFPNLAPLLADHYRDLGGALAEMGDHDSARRADQRAAELEAGRSK